MHETTVYLPASKLCIDSKMVLTSYSADHFSCSQTNVTIKEYVYFWFTQSTKIKLRLGTRPSKTQEGGFAGRLRVGVYQAECMELAHTHFASGILSPIRTPTTSPASRSVSLNYTSVVQLVFLLQPDFESFMNPSPICKLFNQIINQLAHFKWAGVMQGFSSEIDQPQSSLVSQASHIFPVGRARRRGKNMSGHYGQLSVPGAGCREVQNWLVHSDQTCYFCIPAV